eukprot:6312138-Amphidinium_carterae.1
MSCDRVAGNGKPQNRTPKQEANFGGCFLLAVEVETLDGTQNEWGWSKSKLGANAILAVSAHSCA